MSEGKYTKMEYLSWNDGWCSLSNGGCCTGDCHRCNLFSKTKEKALRWEYQAEMEYLEPKILKIENLIKQETNKLIQYKKEWEKAKKNREEALLIKKLDKSI